MVVEDCWPYGRVEFSPDPLSWGLKATSDVDERSRRKERGSCQDACQRRARRRVVVVDRRGPACAEGREEQQDAIVGVAEESSRDRMKEGWKDGRKEGGEEGSVRKRGETGGTDSSTALSLSLTRRDAALLTVR